MLAEDIVENAAASGTPKNFAEDVERVMESAAAAPGSALARIKRRMAILVISGALLAIAQGLIGFAQFLETFLGGLIPRVFVRMKFYRELAVSLLISSSLAPLPTPTGLRNSHVWPSFICDFRFLICPPV